ncbi:MAG TPA: WbqC family protein, partial [Bacteroidales bacterium]|nr:WbqC family protein [Bacteroidales bacterium]
MIRAAIHQPNFIPWTGYFHKISMVDKFVFFDDVQFPRGKTFGSRVKIKTANGEAWITVPVLSKGDLVNFNEIKIDNSSPWQRKSMKTIELSYKKARFFEKYHESFSSVFLQKYEKLSDLNISMIKYLSEALGLNVSFHLSSEIPFEGGNAEDKILVILKELQATTYVSGSGAGSR